MLPSTPYTCYKKVWLAVIVLAFCTLPLSFENNFQYWEQEKLCWRNSSAVGWWWSYWSFVFHEELLGKEPYVYNRTVVKTPVVFHQSFDTSFHVASCRPTEFLTQCLISTSKHIIHHTLTVKDNNEHGLHTQIRFVAISQAFTMIVTSKMKAVAVPHHTYRPASHCL
jgi:hypothetical protein